MAAIDNLLEALAPKTIAREVTIRHDNARVQYQLRTSTVSNWREFEAVIADYYAYHYTTCVAVGAKLFRDTALGDAKALIERQYQNNRSGGSITTAFDDAHDGTNGGLRGILDIIADSLKNMATTHYMRGVFDRYIAPNDFDAKVSILRQLFARLDPSLLASIDISRPERYAQNYQDVIHAYVSAIQHASSVLRRT